MTTCVIYPLSLHHPPRTHYSINCVLSIPDKQRVCGCAVHCNWLIFTLARFGHYLEWAALHCPDIHIVPVWFSHCAGYAKNDVAVVCCAFWKWKSGQTRLMGVFRCRYKASLPKPGVMLVEHLTKEQFNELRWSLLSRPCDSSRCWASTYSSYWTCPFFPPLLCLLIFVRSATCGWLTLLCAIFTVCLSLDFSNNMHLSFTVSLCSCDALDQISQMHKPLGRDAQNLNECEHRLEINSLNSHKSEGWCGRRMRRRMKSGFLWCSSKDAVLNICVYTLNRSQIVYMAARARSWLYMI